MKIGVDLMGGDNPKYLIKALEKYLERENDEIICFAQENNIVAQEIEEKLKLKVIYCSQNIEKDDDPAFVIRKKKDSSLIVGSTYLRDNKIDAFISAGSTGAIVAAGIFILKRSAGISKPALPGFLPRPKSKTPVMLLDLGANIHATKENMLQYSELAQEYMGSFYGVKNPTIKILNIGIEENKGIELQREVYKELSKKDNFKGNIEARDILCADCDIILMDGWTGNIMLKSIEGTVEFFGNNLKSIFYKNISNKIAALVLKNDFKKMYNQLDYRELGATPVLGVDGLILKAHGSSDKRAFYKALLQAKKLYSI